MTWHNVAGTKKTSVTITASPSSLKLVCKYIVPLAQICCYTAIVVSMKLNKTQVRTTPALFKCLVA
jgi:hypothetical protein